MTAVDHAELKRDSRAPLPPEILADAIGRIWTDEVFEVGERLIHGDNLIAMAVERLRAHAALLSEIEGLKAERERDLQEMAIAARNLQSQREELFALRAQAPDSWRPIETAPKDTHILVFGDDLKWRGMNGLAVGYAHSDYNGHEGFVSLDGRCGPTSPRPTHWMPLPAAPALRPQTAESGK